MMLVNDTNFRLFLPSALKARALAKAQAMGVSLAEVVRLALVAYLETP